jgi:hypothetical protein
LLIPDQFKSSGRNWKLFCRFLLFDAFHLDHGLMQINAEIFIPFPRPLVFATYRDQLLNLVPYLPNVRGISTKQRSQGQGRVKIVNEWHGGGEIPPAARALLSESMLSWTEYTDWNPEEFTTDWQIKTHAFTEAVTCVGKNLFLECGAGTQLVSRGKLTID